MDEDDCVSIYIAPAYSLQPHPMKNRKISVSSYYLCSYSPQSSLMACSQKPQSSSPKKLPIELTDSYATLRDEIAIKSGGCLSYDVAARKLIADGDFELLSRMSSARLIRDWENMARFVLKHCKENFLSFESSAKRINWVFSRAPTSDIAAVAKDYLICIDDDVYKTLFKHGFPRDEKTLTAIKMALKSE
jgi:hypothetical protein